MKNHLLATLALLVSASAFSQTPSNDNCASADSIPVGLDCYNKAGTLYNATTTNPTGSCAGAARRDVWYRFRAYTSYVTVNVSLTGGGTSTITTTNTFVELFNTSNCTINNTSLGTCSNVSQARTFNNLTPGQIYMLRVYTTSGTAPNTASTFNVCLTVPRTSRMNEVFKLTTLSAANVLNDPWEVTYGPDNYLWITESKGYKVYRVDPSNGNKTTVLNLATGATGTGALPAPYDSLRAVNMSTWNPWPQGGLAGLVLHPDFLNPDSAFVYVTYVHRSLGGSSPSGLYYRNKILRLKYNSVSGVLENPEIICDTIPGSKDHNSQRMIIAPIEKGGRPYLFYACGDMGAGQFENRTRPMHAQMPNFYDGKILRFNLSPDGDTDPQDKWIPDDNPYNGSKENAVWCIGIRNNQGFAYDTLTNILYGSSHGPYSDDEINIIERRRNYGHPLVIGKASDGNYNGSGLPVSSTSLSAGSSWADGGVSSCPPVVDEMANKNAIDASGNGLYKDPFFSAYPVPKDTIQKIWGSVPTPSNNASFGGWPSEAWSGLDIYSSSIIPGWKRSLLAASLKWGRVIRLKLDGTGQGTLPANDATDTVIYFGSTNRYRDIAFSPDGKDMYIVMDKSSTTSGPSANNPVAPACPGCLLKYTFLGYNVDKANQNKSYIPNTVTIATGKDNVCDSVNTVTINDANGNNNLWVPLTDTSSNIVAEIYAKGQNLGRVTASIYHNANGVRSKNGKRYLDRNITITPQFQPDDSVKIRLYITDAEYQALKNASGSGIAVPSDVKIFKNNDLCASNIGVAPTAAAMDFNMEPFGTSGYVLQGTIRSFSTFYFGSNSLTTLPLELITFTGVLQNRATHLKWETNNEQNTAQFIVERSTDNSSFASIGSVDAAGNTSTVTRYTFVDRDVTTLPAGIVYYRLKVVDADGSFKYSSTITVSLADIAGRISIFPNPADHEVKLLISAANDGKARWRIADNAGRVIMQSTMHLRKGNNSVTIDINKLASGLYYLQVSGNGIDQMVKLQKL